MNTIDNLSRFDGDYGQVSIWKTPVSRGNGQVGQVDSLSAREVGDLSDNGFHLSTCPNIDIFNGFNFLKMIENS